jgi:serine/threonine protein kinase
MGGVPAAIGKYAPVGRLGSGGMADIFLVVARGPERVERLAVLKRLRHPERPDLVAMFLDEARLAVRLTHPNIVHTYEVHASETGKADDDQFMTMEYLEGQPLSEVLQALTDRGQGLSEACVASIAAQALKGLHYAHEFCDFDGTSLGVVHRDVSPHNIFVTYSGEVKILDFGIAKAHLNSTRTETGILKGKLRYMSPEQAGEQDVDRRSDVFGFGIVLWEMLARRPLFTGDAITLLNQIATCAIPRLSSVRPEISPEIEAIVQKALRRDRDERYPTADAMRVDIQRALRGAGDDDSRAELARVMNELFASERDMVRSQVRIHLAKPSGRESFSSQPSLEASLPTLVASTPEQSSSPPLTTSRRERGARGRWRWLAAGGAALAIAGGVVGLELGHSPATRAGFGADSIAPANGDARTPRLHLETTPPGAYVEWQGHRFGPTPIDVLLPLGTQTLAISHEGYDPIELTVAIQAGEDIARAVAFQPRPLSAPSAQGTDTSVGASTPRDPKPNVSIPRAARSTSTPTSTPPLPIPPAPSASAPSAIKVQMLDESDSQ